MAQALRGLSSETLADQAYQAIRDAIASGELKRGEKITERGLAERLSVSPTPVREALRRLEQDRLVRRTGPRSVQVAALEQRTVRELSLIEARLRALAARFAAEHATESDHRKMAKVLDAADAELARVPTDADAPPGEVAKASQRVLARLREFHQLVDRAGGNDMLLHMLHMAEAFTIDERTRALRDRVTAGYTSGPKGRYAQHRRLLDAIVAGDGDTAEALMLAHAQQAGDELIKAQA